MASMEKFTEVQVAYKLRHVTRESKKPSKNIDIDPTKTKDNFSLIPDGRGSTVKSAMEYYHQRIGEVYKYNRDDVNTAIQWVITAPSDLDPEQEDLFWLETYSFLNNIYGEENCIQAIVNVDEGVRDKNGTHIAGRNHMHYTFIPIVKNEKFMKPNKKGNITKQNSYREKVSADALITKQHLREWHPLFQAWLDSAGIKCTVHSGITGGKNRSVEELKTETKEQLKLKEKVKNLEKENAKLKEKVKNLEKTVENHQKTENFSENAGWGSSDSGWGTSKKTREEEVLW